MDKQPLLATRSSPVYTQPSASYVNNFIIIYINLPFVGRLIAPARQSHREVASAPLAHICIQDSSLSTCRPCLPRSRSDGAAAISLHYVLRLSAQLTISSMMSRRQAGGLRRQTVTPSMMIPHLTRAIYQGPPSRLSSQYNLYI